MRNYDYYAGIDPGRTGALAVINRDGIPWVAAMPPEHERGINLEELRDVLSGWDVAGTLVALEWNTARPGEVPDFAYRFGLQSGQLDAMLYTMGFTVRHLSPNLWTGKLGLPGKTWAGAIHQRAALWDAEYPAYMGLIRGPRGGILDGLLDALLIAHWLRLTGLSPVGRKGGKRPPRFFGFAPEN